MDPFFRSAAVFQMNRLCQSLPSCTGVCVSVNGMVKSGGPIQAVCSKRRGSPLSYVQSTRETHAAERHREGDSIVKQTQNRNSSRTRRISRRRFLHGAGAALMLPPIVSASTRGAEGHVRQATVSL